MTHQSSPDVAEDRRHDRDRPSFDRKCAELKRRLERVTGAMSTAERDALVVKMTRLRFKYQTRSALPESWCREGA